MAWLEEPVTTLAFCWRIERRDGIGIGLTAHDRDLTIDGNRYRTTPGMTPSAIRRADGSDADTMDVEGAFASAAIREDELLNGRWDGARVTLCAVDWTDTANRLALGGGRIGSVETRNGRFTAELRGAAAALDRPASEVTSPECRAELGDRRCRIALAARRTVVRVTAIADEGFAIDAPAGDETRWRNGRVRWLDGANAGSDQSVHGVEGAVVTLRARPRAPVAVGDRAILIEGCDKSIATCTERFANAANFRGEPFLPGMDLLTRYPGA